jgi:hypothetical protein
MNKITFEEYKSAIRAQYGVSKIEDVSGILLNPTPAQLRNLCLMRLDNGLTIIDGNIFRIFFNVTEKENLRKAIENFDIGKFKPVISFLKGEKDSENSSRIELAAVLVDFIPRPYSKFLIYDNKGERSDSGVSLSVRTQEFVKDDLAVKNEVELKDNYNSPGKKSTIIIAVLLSLFFMGYTVKGLFFPKKECMKWEVNHYVEVDCTNENSETGQPEAIVPIDERAMKLMKLDPKEKHEFFKNEKPLIWYQKKEGVVELFNASGFHPETGKPLKPITKYMIEKYNFK